jgi:hypothetical protein
MVPLDPMWITIIQGRFPEISLGPLTSLSYDGFTTVLVFCIIVGVLLAKCDEVAIIFVYTKSNSPRRPPRSDPRQ